MAIVVDVIDDGVVTPTVVEADNPLAVVWNNTITQVSVPTESTVINVMAGVQGVPGVQNVVVSATEPSSPFEGLIWIDVS